MQSRISREQLYALFMLRARGNNIFSTLPRDVIRYMGALHPHPKSDIQSLLSYIADGQLKEVKVMLAKNPRLVMQSGDVETPSGLKVLHVPPLECGLGAGDPEIVAVIHEAFERITDKQGKMVADALDVRASQYARYRPHIENMLNQTPYDFSGILYAIKQASAADVQAELNLVEDYQSDLRVALNQFREYFTPGQITVGMHCNYQDFSRGFEVYDEEFDELHRTSNNNDDKLTLFSRQILGFIQLMTFPAVERMAWAQGLYDLVENSAPLKRSFKFKYGVGEFPTTGDNQSNSGLGFVYWACGARGARVQTQCRGPHACEAGDYLSSKNFKLAKLMQWADLQHDEQPSRCVIC